MIKIIQWQPAIIETDTCQTKARNCVYSATRSHKQCNLYW